MRWLSRLLRRNRLEKRLDSELRDHLERQVADYIAAGMSERQARRRASLEFGGLDQVKELCRDVRGTRWLEELAHDVRYGIRVFRRNPSFTTAAVLSLALGIGANTAIFTLVDATLLKPLTVREPHRLVELLTEFGNSRPSNAFSYQALTYLQDHTTTVDVIASHQSNFFVGVGTAPPEHSIGQYVTGDFFEILGVPAAHGRGIQPSDDRGGTESVVVLSHRYWQRRFGGDRLAIGRTVRLDNRAFTIVGVAPSSFRGLIVARDVDFWVPLWSERLIHTPSQTSDAGYNWLQVVGRVRSGHSVEEARAEMTALFHAAVVEPKLALVKDPDRLAQFKAWRPRVQSARTGLASMRQEYGEPLIVLLAISGLVLLTACVNVANLLLARANSRRHEVAVRLSLGAGRARVIRQLLTESVLLSSAGTAVGVMLAYAACDYLARFFASTRNPITLELGPDPRILIFATVLALATALLFGLVPALRTTSVFSPAASLQSGNRVAGRRDRQTLNRALVATQVALSVIMLFCGGLFLRSLYNIRSVDTGFDSSGVLMFNGDASSTQLEASRLRSMYREAIVRLEAIPGVRSASVSQFTPIWGGGNEGTISVHRPGTTSPAKGLVSVNRVSPGYFATTGTPLYTGRDVSWQDSVGSVNVAIVNRTLSSRYFGNESAIGKHIELRGETYEIIGVVGDALYYGLRSSVPPTMYTPWIQQGDELLTSNVPRAQFAIRTEIPPHTLATVAREAVLEAMPAMGIMNVRTFEQQLDVSIVRDRILSILSGLFALLGLLLAGIGLYGLMAYTVARRTSEIGIRMALGAEATQIGAMVVREALILIAGGIALGLVAALLLARLLETLLFGLRPNDSTTALAVVAVMVVTGLAAAYFPSRRAARINPTLALRTD